MARTADGDYEGAVEIGLTQSYKDKPGYVTMQIYAKFPTLGDYSTDSTRLASFLLSASANLVYREHKNL